jgi:anti-anti-sigma regulatory factor
MLSYSVDESGRVLTISYSHHVNRAEVADCLDAVRNRMDQLRPGFVLLSDLTSLESMDPDCAESLGALMELLNDRGIALILRVIPDPAKDIGFNLIAQFHVRRPVRVQTLTNLAEALKILLDESPELAPAA